MTDTRCHLCSGELSLIPGYETLGRVTSDCRPWPAGGALAVCQNCDAVQKPTDAAWQTEIAEIYRTYAIYSQSGGKEQKVFTSAGGISRSATLLDQVIRSVVPPSAGRLLDIGCGNGELLANAARLLPGWRLSGTELSDQHRKTIESIPGIEAFHSGEGSLEAARGPFDLVTMVHCLEHIPNPAAMLDALQDKIGSSGHLVVEVPDFRRNPFDLLIVDHCTHFSPDRLSEVTESSGFALDLLRTDLVPKELTLIAHSGVSATEKQNAGSDGNAGRQAVAWLGAVLGQARDCAARRPFGLFGTAIAAQWLFGCLPDAVEFFVDEDPDRVGRESNGRPILSPAQLPPGASVFVPLAPAVAAAVCARLGPAFIEPVRFDPAT